MDPSRVVDRVFSHREVLSCDPIHHGNRKQTSVVDFAEQQSVVVQTATDIESLRSEAAVTAAIGNATAVPVPTVLGGGVIDETAYLLTEQVPGQNLHDRFARLATADRQTVVKHFGRSLGEIHAAYSFDACGDVLPVGQEWKRPLWPTDAAVAELDVCGAVGPQTWLRDVCLDAVERLPAAFDAETRRLRKRLLSSTGDTLPQPHKPVLFPWDFRPGNALIDADGLTAMLDWEAPKAAPAALSVAKAEYLIADWYVETPAAERNAFRAGYEAVRSYPAIAPIHRVLAVIMSAVDSTGTVTNPMYPELDRPQAIEFHRAALASHL